MPLKCVPHMDSTCGQTAGGQLGPMQRRAGMPSANCGARPAVAGGRSGISGGKGPRSSLS